MNFNISDADSITEVIKKRISYFKEVHEKSISYVSQLTDENLAKPTTNGIDFGGEDSVMAIIKHAIRHEGVHTGHLSWLCKLFGVKTI